MAESDRIRTTMLTLNLSQKERAMLEINSEEYGLSKSDYLRKLILVDKLTNREWIMSEEEGISFISEINKIGNKLNRIAYNTNVKKATTIEDWNQIKNIYRELLILISNLSILDEKSQEAWGFYVNKFPDDVIENNEERGNE